MIWCLIFSLFILIISKKTSKLAEFKLKSQTDEKLTNVALKENFEQGNSQMIEVIFYNKDNDNFSLIGALPYLVIVDNYRMISFEQLEGKKSNPTVVDNTHKFSEIIVSFIQKNENLAIENIYFSVRVPFKRIFEYTYDSVNIENEAIEGQTKENKTVCRITYKQVLASEIIDGKNYLNSIDTNIKTTFNYIETEKYPLFIKNGNTNQYYQKIRYTFIQNMIEGVPESPSYVSEIDGECNLLDFDFKEELMKIYTVNEKGAYFDSRIGCADCFDYNTSKIGNNCVKSYSTNKEIGCAENSFTCDPNLLEECIKNNVKNLLIEIAWSGEDSNKKKLKSQGQVSYHYKAYSAKNAINSIFTFFTK